MTTRPLLLKVFREVMDDGDPDLSWLGEFRQPRSNDWCIDRARGELLNPQGRVMASYAGGGVNVNRGAYPFFIPVANHIPHKPRNWPGGNKAWPDVVKQFGSVREADYAYALQDWRRAEAYGTTWSTVGVRAGARVLLVTDVVQVFWSHGLWGIDYAHYGDEREASESYLDDVFYEELPELADQLIAIGCVPSGLERHHVLALRECLDNPDVWRIAADRLEERGCGDACAHCRQTAENLAAGWAPRRSSEPVMASD